MTYYISRQVNIFHFTKCLKCQVFYTYRKHTAFCTLAAVRQLQASVNPRNISFVTHVPGTTVHTDEVLIGSNSVFSVIALVITAKLFDVAIGRATFSDERIAIIWFITFAQHNEGGALFTTVSCPIVFIAGDIVAIAPYTLLSLRCGL